MTVLHSYDPPERFVAGTVGPPGGRTFFLQARAGVRITSVALEKQQVAVLAERIDELLDEVIRAGGELVVPALAPDGLEDDAPLEQPIVEEFRAGTMTLSWDGEREQVVVEVFPVQEVVLTDEAVDDLVDADENDEDVDLAAILDPEPDEMLVIRLAPGAARSFAKRAERVVNAGRPPCPFCGGPVDPEGHLCPRANGFRRTQP